MNHEVYGLMLDVREGGVFQILDEVRRHTENAAYLVHPELPGRKELAVLRRQGDGFV